MISPAHKIIAISTASLGIGGLVFWTVDEYSKKTISENLNGVKLVSDFGKVVKDGTWMKLFSKLDENTEANTEKFKEISNLLKKRNEVADGNYYEGATKLKKACESSRSSKYSTLFTRNDELMDDVKSFCSIKIEKVLYSDGLLTFSKKFSDLTDTERAYLINNLFSLFQHEEANGMLDSRLLSLKNSLSLSLSRNTFSPTQENKKSLFEWCKDNVHSYYLNDSDNRILLTKKYCTHQLIRQTKNLT